MAKKHPSVGPWTFMPLGNLYLVEVTVKCMPGLVHDSYLSLYDLHPPPEVRGHLQLESLNFFHPKRHLIFSGSYCILHTWPCSWLLPKPWWPSTSPRSKRTPPIWSLSFFHAIRQLKFSGSYCKMHTWPCSWLLPKPWWPSNSPWSKRTPPTWVLELLSCHQATYI